MTVAELIGWLSEQEPSHEVYVWNEVAKQERPFRPDSDIDTDRKTGRIVIDGQFPTCKESLQVGRPVLADLRSDMVERLTAHRSLGAKMTESCPHEDPCEGGAPESQEEVTSGSGWRERWEVAAEAEERTS